MRYARRSIPATVVALAVLVGIPAAAAACSVALQPRTTSSARDVVVPIHHTGSRAAWGLDGSWRSMRPSVLSSVKVEGSSRAARMNATTRTAQRLTFMAFHQRASLFWTDDEDSATTCGSVNEPVYTRPQLRVRETPRAVLATFVTRRTVPEGDGCRAVRPYDLAQDPVAGISNLPAWLNNSCLGTIIVDRRLSRPIGDRNLVLDWVPAPA